jgi:RNA polymerase sigma-70 factor (ECF subfamily)
LARAQGIPLDAASDVVQETLVEAWRHLDALCTPDGFDAWLGAVCRNVCRRHRQAASVRALRERSLDDPAAWSDTCGVGTESGMWQTIDVVDPHTLDPTEELERADLQTLLDQALGYLALPAREAVELCYLEELPQREAARQLGLTIQALEARLHRARKQLREVLRGQLREPSLALGVLLEEPEEMVGWSETRLWCTACGNRRLLGTFEVLPKGRVNMRLRCPGCGYHLNSYGHVPLRGMRSFRPAYKRVMQAHATAFLPGLSSGSLPCFACGTPQPLHIIRRDAPHALTRSGGQHHQQQLSPPHAAGLVVSQACAACEHHHANVAVSTILWSSPVVQQFIAAHPRYVSEPETIIDYQGLHAIRVRMVDVLSAARLTLIVHPQTLHVLLALQH